MNLISLTAYDVITYLFGLIVLVSIGVIIINKNSSEYFKKIIGGLSILIFALVIKNPYVAGVSVFIGGLLIATENFLLHLASVFKIKSEDVGSVLDHYNDREKQSLEKTEKATPQEMQEKIQEEITPEQVGEIVSTALKNVGEKIKQETLDKQREEQFKKRRDELAIVEEKGLNLIKSLCFLEEGGLHYQEGYKISNENGIFIPDAIIWDDNNRIRLGIEIKYVQDSHMPLNMIIRRAIERIRFFKFDFPFILAVVGKNITFENIKPYIKEYEDIKLLFMNYDEEKKKVLPINVISFSNMISLLREGDIVRHKLFGKGKILETSNGMSMVKFDSHGGLRRIENAFLTRLI